MQHNNCSYSCTVSGAERRCSPKCFLLEQTTHRARFFLRMASTCMFLVACYWPILDEDARFRLMPSAYNSCHAFLIRYDAVNTPVSNPKRNRSAPGVFLSPARGRSARVHQHLRQVGAPVCRLPTKQCTKHGACERYRSSFFDRRKQLDLSFVRFARVGRAVFFITEYP